MSADFFVDTNVFVYALDSSDPTKQAIAATVVRRALGGQGVTSSQVAQEFLNVVLKRASTPLGVEDARRALDAMILPLVQVWASAPLYHRALDVKARWGFGFYDSLIVAAALQARVSHLLTEDLQHGQRVEGLRIENPFAA